jgi:hypothetical protein
LENEVEKRTDFILRRLRERARILPMRRLPFAFGLKVPRRLPDRSNAIHMLAQKGKFYG